MYISYDGGSSFFFLSNLTYVRTAVLPISIGIDVLLLLDQVRLQIILLCVAVGVAFCCA